MLPIAALAVVLFIVWLASLDTYPRVALIVLPVVSPITSVAIALPIGLLLPIRHATRFERIDRRAQGISRI